MASSSFLYSPLRPRAMGASTMMRSPWCCRKNLFEDLSGRLASDFGSAQRAMRNAHGRIKQAEIIVDFGNCADG